jgi:hypothetical protein
MRGRRLGAFQALRSLALGVGGRMEEGRYYIRSGLELSGIAPFSLDGRPPAPKPATTALDAAFEPYRAPRADFRTALMASLRGTAKPGSLLALHSGIASWKFDAFGGDPHRDLPERWLAAELGEPGVQESDGLIEFLTATIAMAAGEKLPSTEYTLRQIWRHLQEDSREEFFRLRLSVRRRGLGGAAPERGACQEGAGRLKT